MRTLPISSAVVFPAVFDDHHAQAVNRDERLEPGIVGLISSIRNPARVGSHSRLLEPPAGVKTKLFLQRCTELVILWALSPQVPGRCHLFAAVRAVG